VLVFPLGENERGRASFAFEKSGGVRGSGTGWRHQASIGHEPAQLVILRRGSRGNDVCDGPAAKGHANLLAATHSSQCLAERQLQLANTDFTHVYTLAAMRSQPRTNETSGGG